MSNPHLGKTCPYCQTPIKPDAEVMVCPACQVPHHGECWQTNGGCTTYGCTLRPGGQPQVAPPPMAMPPQPGAMMPPQQPYGMPSTAPPPRANGMAIGVLIAVILVPVMLVIMATLGLIVVPRVMGASRKAKESTLRANLQMIRNAVSQFQADTGYYPTTLSELVATDAGGLIGNYGADTASVKTSYRGPYLSLGGGINATGIPANPMTTPHSDPDLAHHWTYDPFTGTVITAVSGQAMDGRRYEDF